MTAQLDAVIRQIEKIPDSEFTEYRGGWPGQIGSALVDAVFSIRAKYDSKIEGRGVLGRTRTLVAKHPQIRNDLQALVELGSAEIKAVMGDAVSSKRPKSECVVDAAEKLLALDPGVRKAEDILGGFDDGEERRERIKKVRKAYVGVRGLGDVTAEYFTMLLGIPGVKADTMITEFINQSLKAADLPSVDSPRSRALVEAAYDATKRGETLTHFDHAIWRTKGKLVASEDARA